MPAAGAEGRADFGRRFGQLYASVMQKYIIGQDFLDENSKRQLVSVMVEVEQASLPKLLGSQQGSIKNAIEKEKLSALQTEYDSLFGTATSTGQLSKVLEFDYGQGGQSPEKLTEPEGMIEGD